jgi:membrane protein required for colicin V production
MNLVDLALTVLLLLCAIRGFWRGLIRESFGFAAFLVGLLAALRFADPVGQSLQSWEILAALPDAARVGGAFVIIFLLASAAINVLGFALDRLFGRGLLRGVGGGIVGVAKGAAVLSFVLLFFHLFPFVRGLDDRLAGSRLARPMISAADNLLRSNWSSEGSAAESA